MNVVHIKPGDEAPSPQGDYVQVVRTLPGDGSQAVSANLTAHRHQGEPGEGFGIDQQKAGLTYDDTVSWAKGVAEDLGVETVLILDRTA